MSHSLIIGRQVELFGGGEYIDSGPAAGAVIRVGDFGGNSGLDLGAGEPQTTVISSLLLDGERPVGRRTGNASVTLPIYVRAPGLQALFAARELVLQIVDQETWEMVLTLDGMQPTVFDCLRAKTSLPFRVKEIDQDVLVFNVTCQRLPFGRSDTQETLSILAPPGTAGGGAISLLPDVRLDGFEAVTGTTIIYGTTWTLSTTERYGSSGANAITTTGTSVFQRNITTVDLSSYTSLRFWTAVSGKTAVSRTYWIVLYDNQGLAWHLPPVTATLPGGIKYVASYIMLKTTVPPTGFRTNQVVKYQFKTTAGIYLDDLDAIDSSVNVIGGTRGGAYEIHGIKGSARTPINIDINRPSGATITSGLVHHPKERPDSYLPLVQLNPATPIDGRTVALPSGGSTLRPWSGTYSVVLAIAALAGGSSTSRTTTVTLTQTGAGYTDAVSASRTYTPSEIGTAKYLYLNRMTLPARAIPPDNVGVSWTLTISCTLGGGLFDSFTDLMFLDTAGQTVVWQGAAAATHIYVDEPDPVVVSHGRILSGSSHAAASSIGNKITTISGEPFGLDPGENAMLVHVVDGAAQLTINYAPRWHGIRAY